LAVQREGIEFTNTLSLAIEQEIKSIKEQIEESQVKLRNSLSSIEITKTNISTITRSIEVEGNHY